jgi:HK97 family phage prohead protease
MARLQKIHPVLITSVKGKVIRALVSTWDVVDFQGDRVRRGAFLNSIREWEESGDKLPFLWSHGWSDPFAHLGVVNSMRENDRVLEVEAEILDDNEFAQQVKRLIEQRRVTDYSFAYDTIRENRLDDGSTELLELKLLECGPCLSGANPYTDTLSRKAVQDMLARETGASRMTDSLLAEKLRSYAKALADNGLISDSLEDVQRWIDSYVELSFGGEVRHFDDYLQELGVLKTTSAPTPKTTDPEIPRLNSQLDEIAGSRDADVLRRLDELEKGLVISADYSGVLTRASALLAQSAVRATVAGLPDAEAALMEASRQLRTIASGGEGSVEDVIAACRPLIAELRAVNPIAAANLERTLAELAGGVGVPYVENEDRVEGSVGVTDNVTDDRDRYEPKHVIDGRVDARMRPLGEPVAPIHDGDGETYRLPAVTTDPDSWRVEKKDAV